MADFFKSKTDDNTRFQNLTKEKLKEEFDKKLKEPYYAKYRSYINPKVVDTSLDAAMKIYQKIVSEYGNDCVIYSEKKVVGQGYSENSTFPVVGRIDLMVVSRDGRIGIFDFKCSPKEYTETNS
jgi:hypothetical protein